MNKTPAKSGQKPGEASRSGMKRFGVILILAFIAVFLWLTLRPGAKEKSNESAVQVADGLKGTTVKPARAATTGADEASAPVAGTALIPQPMQLNQKEVVRKKWNSTEDALTRMEPPKGEEGGTMGPHSVVYVKDTIYVLDSVSDRLIGYDKKGRMVSSVPLPNTRLAVDLVVDPTDSSIFVIDQLEQFV